MSLVDEYLAITGRPAFTLTVDEFLKLREPVEVQRQRQEKKKEKEQEVSYPIPKEPVVSQKKEEEKKISVSNPAPHKEVQSNPSPKNTQSPKNDILALLKSIPG